MFFLGIELDLDQIKKSWKTTIPIAGTSILFPGKYIDFSLSKKKKKNVLYMFLVGIGCAVAVWFYQTYASTDTNKVAFILFIGKIGTALT